MKTNIYLNFDGNTAEAFDFYKSIFGGEYIRNMKMSEAPGGENFPDEEKNRTMHISLPLGEHSILMASDTVPSMGHKLVEGNNAHISIHPDSRKEAERLFNALSEGGEIEMPLEDQFWGDYYGSFKDKFGIQWMVNHSKQD